MLSFACTSDDAILLSEISNFLKLKKIHYTVKGFNIILENPDPIWNDGFVIQMKFEALRKQINFGEYDIICSVENNKAYWYINGTNLSYFTEFDKDLLSDYREFINCSLKLLFNKFHKELITIYRININK